MNGVKNYPRYPVDLYSRELIFIVDEGNRAKPLIIVADALRVNPFGRAFVHRGRMHDN